MPDAQPQLDLAAVKDEGKLETLRFLLTVAGKTQGAEVWRALFAEMIIRIEERRRR